MKVRTLFFLIILFAFTIPVASQELQTKGNTSWDGKTRPNIQQMQKLQDEWRAQGKTETEISGLLSGVIINGGSGVISGKIFQNDGHSPLPSYSYVYVYDEYGYLEQNNYVPSYDTLYSVPGLYPGLHYVQAVSSGNFLDKFYDGTIDWRQATLVETFNDSTITDINFQLDPAKVITGKVLDADSFDPLSSNFANFYLYKEDASSEMDYYDSFEKYITEDGSYYLNNIRAGNYKLRIFITEFATEYFNDKDNFKAADIIHVTEQTDTVGFINFLLDPFVAAQDGYEQNNDYENAYEFSIGDEVTPQINPAGDIDFFTFTADSADTVDIILEAQSIESRLYAYLTLFDSSGTKSLGSWSSNGGGDKKKLLSKIAAASDIEVKNKILHYTGRYFLRVINNFNLDGGDDFFYKLSVKYSDHIIPTYGFIAGNVFLGNDTTLYSGSSYTIYLYRSDGSYYDQYSSDDPSYILGNIPSGDYKLNISVPNEGFLSEWYENAQSLDDAMVITLVDSVTDINFILDPSGGILGRLFLNNTSSDFTGGGYLNLYDADSRYYTGFNINPDAKGLFLVSGILPGEYTLRFNTNSSSEDYPPVWYGDVGSQGNAKSLTVSAGDTTKGITMILKRGGFIQGFVKSAGEVLSSDTMLVNIIPYDEVGFVANYISRNTFCGGYRTSFLYPGTYKLQTLAQNTNLSSWYYNSGNIFDDPGSQTIEIKSDSTYEVTINLNMANGSISGIVFKEDGVTPDNQPGIVYAYDETGHMVQSSIIGIDPQTGQALEKGHYRISGLKGGTYYLMLILNFFQNQERILIQSETEKLTKLDIIRVREEQPIKLTWYPEVEVKDIFPDQLFFQQVPSGAITVDVTESQNTGGRNFYGLSTSINTENKTILPEQFELSAVYPNPFNPSTTLTFGVPNKSHVKIEIFDMLGRKVATVLDEVKSSGWHNVKWNGRNSLDQMVGSGLYVARLQAAGIQSSKKLLLIR